MCGVCGADSRSCSLPTPSAFERALAAQSHPDGVYVLLLRSNASGSNASVHVGNQAWADRTNMTARKSSLRPAAKVIRLLSL